MKRIITLASALLLATLAFNSCGEKAEPDKKKDEGFALLINVPATLDVEEEQLVSMDYYSGKGPKPGDEVVFRKEGTDYVSPVTKVSNESFSFNLPAGMNTGNYEFIIRRGSVNKSVGRIYVTVTKKIDISPAEGTSVYGIVYCDGAGLPGVQVSDGYEIAVTDANGIYQLQSEKKNRMVFITIPSGYMPRTTGVQVSFFQTLKNPSNVAERRDFELFKTPDQTNHTMMFFGDMHLANRTNDRNQFAKFSKEIGKYVSTHGGDQLFATTLGDMTWDLYWYDKNYTFTNYLADINQNVSGLSVFHTMGNHDHDMRTSVNGSTAGWDAVDWDTAHLFRDVLGPNYYSFNIGEVHYISLDDIYCKNTTGGASGDRKYDEKVGGYVLDWLKKDLSYVDKSKTVVVTMHAPVYNQTGGNALADVTSLVSCFSGFTNVLFVTGHSHKLWTVDKGAIKEHNSGAVCAAWWWSGYYVPELNIAQDGGPGGYRIMDFKGGQYTSYFKSVGRPESYQFRSYDRNQINIDPGKVEHSSAYASYLTSHGGYNTASSANEVLINVWDWNNKWKVEVTENGKRLSVTQFTGYDPLYFLTYCEGRFKSTDSPSFDIYKTYHMFKCTASSATSTLEIKVIDDEGREYTETMKRPKAFTVDTYK